MQQHPDAAARRARPRATVMLGQPPLDIGGPAHISEMAVRGAATEDVDEAGHQKVVSDSYKSKATISVKPANPAPRPPQSPGAHRRARSRPRARSCSPAAGPC